MASRKSSSKPMESSLCADPQDHQRTSSTTLASSASPTTRRETPGQQRKIETRTIFAGTAAYTQYGVEETFDRAPQRTSASKNSLYPRAIDHYDLQTNAARTVNESSLKHEHRTARMEKALDCPYHGPILQGRRTNARPNNQGLAPMDRYVAEGPSERYAILHRPDNERVATHNGCRCLEMTQSSADGRGQARK